MMTNSDGRWCFRWLLSSGGRAGHDILKLASANRRHETNSTLEHKVIDPVQFH